LLFAEAVTLAHVARPLGLAAVLVDFANHLALACDARYSRFVSSFPGDVLQVSSIEPAAFLKALLRGTPAYDVDTLERYVAEDLQVIARSQPDVIIGDFRLSLSVSARVAGIPYIALANAYWSPAYRPKAWPVPELPITHALPIAFAQAIFRLGRPAAFALHSRALNRVRRRHGLPSLGPDLRSVYTDADFVAYADAPELFPMLSPPSSHRFVGPVLWEPTMRLPEWWKHLPAERPVVYLTLGSSGQASRLDSIVSEFASMDATLIVATGGPSVGNKGSRHVHAVDFLPGVQASKRASLVICNGGSLTCYQALSAGVPVIGVASNLDQFLNIQAVERAGAGVVVRADRLKQVNLAALARRVLADPRYAESARRASAWCAQHRLAVTVPALLEEVLG
jgi:UDP:flavonoid glycosyltransferase YjiC (YdhE family)